MNLHEIVNQLIMLVCIFLFHVSETHFSKRCHLLYHSLKDKSNKAIFYLFAIRFFICRLKCCKRTNKADSYFYQIAIPFKLQNCNRLHPIYFKTTNSIKMEELEGTGVSHHKVSFKRKHSFLYFILFPAISMMLGWGLRGFIGGGPY